MISFEILKELNKIENSSYEQDINQIKKNLFDIISKNKKESEQFLQTQILTQKQIKILEDIYSLIDKKNEEIKKDQNSTDFQIIWTQYKKWLEIYNLNQNQITEQNMEIVKILIDHYLMKDFEPIERILEIKDSSEFEIFKNQIKNLIRVFYIEKIENYLESEKYKQINFISKLKIKLKILDLIKEIGNYIFDFKKLQNILE